MDFAGLYPAAVVPFRDDLTIDDQSLKRVLEYVTTPAGVQGVVVNGHQGELIFLNAVERAHVVKVAREVVPAHLPVISGIEAATPKALAATAREAVEAGADALLVCPPFDSRPLRHLVVDARAALQYFSAVGDAVDVPLIVFQYAKASGIAYPLDVLERLCELPAVGAVKAGTRDITDYVHLYDHLAGAVPVLAASDGPPLLPMLLHGAQGALIGVSTVGTEIWADLVSEALAGNASAAIQIFRDRCLPLTRAIYENQQPTTLISPVGAAKEALMQLGVISNPTIRPPSLAPDATRKAQIADALDRAGLLSHRVSTAAV